jgi:hypothetical protein
MVGEEAVKSPGRGYVFVVLDSAESERDIGSRSSLLEEQRGG